MPEPAVRTPVWLLDVDGVLNANRAGWGAAPSRATLWAHGRSYKLRWSAVALDRIRALHTSGALELRWCTTWCPWADQLEDRMGLPPLARTLAEEDTVSPGRSMLAKLAVALAVVEQERRPLIWTDDEAIPGFGPNRERLERAGVPVHLVAPTLQRGLRPEHLEAIEAFAAAQH